MAKDETVHEEEVRAYHPPILFPHRLKQSKLIVSMLMFKKLEINIPFAEALAQMPHYAKFMKYKIKKK